MNKLYWLSFTDSTRPAGKQFLGVAIVEITPADVADAKLVVEDRFGSQEGVTDEHRAARYEVAAALRKAHERHINPGGEVGSVDISDQSARVPYPARHRLLSRADLEGLGLA